MLYADIKQHENWIKQCLQMNQDLSKQLFNPFNEAEDKEQFVPIDEDIFCCECHFGG